MNQDYLEKIDAYLNNEMTPVEKSLFESALTQDEELAHTLKMYRTIEADMRNFEKYKLQDDALRNTLNSLNKEYFINEPPLTANVIPLYSNKFFKFTMAIAASICIILVAYFNLLQSDENIQLLADTYFKENLNQISQTVSAPEDTLHFGIAGNKKEKNTTQDSLQTGITAYNNQDYKTALAYFAGVSRNHPENKEAKKYTGLVYLHTREYDQALRKFDELASNHEIQSNSGLFLKAVTLMLRNEPGDKQEAERILQQVVETHAEGNNEAAQWLQKL